MTRWFLAFLLIFLTTSVPAQAPSSASKESKGKKKQSEQELVVQATPASQLKLPPGFQAELLYSVPLRQQGSWVCMCLDPKGRLIVSDQAAGLYRVSLPGFNGKTACEIEPIEVDVREAQGLLWANDSLYVVVNSNKDDRQGLYRVRDTDGDDKLDSLEKLFQIPVGSGEHGPHAVVLAPDGNSLYVICGNRVGLGDYTGSQVPELWDEDMILPRIYGKGFMRDTPAPGGYVARTDFDGKTWELVTVGFRNCYDMAFNADGELLTYDADMEWDVNTPWYRPTRICHVLSGQDYGWRNCSAKFPEYYCDTPKPVLNIGPGSPTGVCFGYGAKFPAKYQQAMYCADWTNGTLHAVHLTPDGSTYTATDEAFCTGTPLPFTDLLIHPDDGALYFLTGGRGLQTGLYRVTYTGAEPVDPVDARQPAGKGERALRHKLEALHGADHTEAVAVAWPYLGNADPAIRNAARTAIEFRPQSEWGTRILTEPQMEARLQALLAICRQQPRNKDGLKPAEDSPVPDWNAVGFGAGGAATVKQMAVLTALGDLDWSKLTPEQKLSGLRILQLALIRFGPPGLEVRDELITRLAPALPAQVFAGNALLLDTLVYLQADAAATGVALLEQAASPQEQIQYAKSLSALTTGWTPELRERYFQWFIRAKGLHGGASFRLFIDDIRKGAVSHLTKDEENAIEPLLKEAASKDPVQLVARPFVKAWTMDEVQGLTTAGLTGRNFEHGRQMFAAAQCFSCHQFQGEGGALGPDLTTLAGRFSVNSILESILEPSRVISDQYAAVQIELADGRTVIGRIATASGRKLHVYTDMLNMADQLTIDQGDIETMQPSPVSMMPQGLLNTLNEEEILDLLAYLTSRGDRNSPMFIQETR